MKEISFSQVSDITKWDTDTFSEAMATFNDPALAKEVARRWNAYADLVAVLKRIAKPSLGGKLQQYQAQQALYDLGEDWR